MGWGWRDVKYGALSCRTSIEKKHIDIYVYIYLIKRPARDACLCMGEHLAPPALPAPPAPHFVFLVTL